MADDTMTGNGDTLGLDNEERLPWLESADDYNEYSGNNGRAVGIVLLGLLILAGLIAAIFWMQGRSAMDGVDGDGSIIAADEGNYKVAPKDPEGKQFEGTGDASFSASEGEAKEAKLAGSSGATADKAKPAAPNAASADASGGVLVQLAAYSSEAQASSGWSSIAGKYEYVAKLPKKIVSATVDGGTVYRLSAVAPNAAAASEVCNKIKASGGACLIVR